ncbi:hypothetical protein [Budvicia diplopodorum]|uniref:hypothetical protein n=1 Tax=Budvicia diplopodorum TaxID=1119056 RepID=UPI001BAE21AC|nr:hypothetical protein [Budvicia diplopodorum]
MPNINAIPVTEQVYLLNKELISKANTLEYAVITVGGQAVQYWVSYFHEYYGDSKPDSVLVTSIDVDYSAKKSDIAAFANSLNIDISANEKGQPPSLARFLLIDRSTHNIKEVDGRYFTEPGTNTPNTLDIIDRPAGFEYTDFDGKKLYHNTEIFLVDDPNTGLQLSHDKIRVLNPIACMQSRFKNITALHRRPEIIEIARIKALIVPVYFFLIQKFEKVDAVPNEEKRAKFTEARKHLKMLFQLVNSRQNMLIQAKYEIKLYQIFESLMFFFRDHQDDYDFNESFWSQDLRTNYQHLHKKYEQLSKAIL